MEEQSVFLFFLIVYFYLIFYSFLALLRGYWGADGGGLGDKWDLGAWCGVPKESI